MAAKFEVYKSTGKTGGYRWRLRASNGEIIASGQRYANKAGAKKGITAVKRALARAELVEL